MEEWIFTFGVGHSLEGKCVRIPGTYDEARQKMIDKYGLHWGFQYSAAEWSKMHNEWYGDFLEKEVDF